MEKDVKCYANVIKTSVMYLQDVVLFLKVYLIFCNRNFIFNYSYTILILTFSDKKLANTKHVTFKPVKNILIWFFFSGNLTPSIVTQKSNKRNENNTNFILKTAISSYRTSTKLSSKSKIVLYF